MIKDIIQHHAPFDFESFYKTVKSRVFNMGYQDLSNFLQFNGEKHSFIGCAEQGARIEQAISNATESESDKKIISNAKMIMMTILRSPHAAQPITIHEIRYLNNFVGVLPKNCVFSWSIAEDTSLANAIKVIMLVNVED